MNVLESSVLVLNRGFTPIRITTVKDAIVKIFLGKAEAIDVDDGKYGVYNFSSWIELSSLKLTFEDLRGDEEWVNTAHLSIEAPQIIRELRYNKVKIRTVRYSRRNILIRDNYTCQYCSKKKLSKELNIDHVIPQSKGGSTTWKNTACTCFDCNAKKRDRTPREAGMKLIRKPFKPKFVPAFRMKLSKHYKSWEHFVSEVYWNIELKGS